MARRSSLLRPRGPVRITANLTPMIDMTFLLIVFFILVTRFSDRERVRLELPRPQSAASSRSAEERRITVNLVPREDRPSALGSIVAAGESYAPDQSGREALAMRITRLFGETPELRLNVRADRELEYRFVEPVLRAITDGAVRAGATPRVNLVVVRGE